MVASPLKGNERLKKLSKKSEQNPKTCVCMSVCYMGGLCRNWDKHC
jgi:hypothetical protein